jgi:hypothetical protein
MDLSDIDKQIAELEAKKRQIIDEEKKTAKKKVELALQELNSLGFNYKLVEEGAAPKRRTGVRDEVLKAVKANNGVRPADIAATLSMNDSKGKQSVANALSALKKAGKVTVENGEYRAA